MTDPVFLAEDLGDARVGATLTLDGDEGRHAVVVRRLRVGERLVLADGRGRGVAGTVTATGRASLDVVVEELLEVPAPEPRYTVAQALVKGDRSELAVEVLTEIGVDEIIPWAARRSVVRWSGERGERARTKWQATAREAAKQSRRLRIPIVPEPVDLGGLCARVAGADVALVLHEEALEPVRSVARPEQGEVLLVVGPEGGIAPEELEALTGAGGRPVLVSDGVLRTSTAGVVACAALMNR